MKYGNEENTETVERLLEDLEIENPKRFSPEQLRTFTSNFSSSLGSGGFGDVYKGTLHNGVQVAVKVLKRALLSDGVKDQFKAEVSVLGKTHHRNLVKLYGFCFEHNMKALVYEFMENESLEKVIYGSRSINWETLCNIAIGTANGLSYLHKDCQPTIIHYDIKPSNILLDSNFSPKVGDFGLAKLLHQDKTHITESRFRGTPNYVAPELTMPYSSITHKCDVYSFGITLFDIIGRRRMVAGEGQNWFPRQVWKKFKEERHDTIMEECGVQEKDREQAKQILLIALWCAQFLPDDRPSMSHVVRILEGREKIAMPPNPFLFLCSSSTSQIEYPTPKSSPSGKASSSFVHISAPNRVQGFTSFSKYLEQPMRISAPNRIQHFTSFSKYLEEPLRISYPFEHMQTYQQRQSERSSFSTRENGRHSIAQPESIVVGPWGGPGGGDWDDGVYTGVKQIQVFRDEREIRSIQIEYVGKDGDSIWSERHGYSGARTIDTIEFNYPSEILKRVTGFYAFQFGDSGFLLMRSLSFFTNKKKYGPFGDETGTYFTSGKDGNVVGFHGRCGAYLDAIGLHVEYSSLG